MPFAPASTCAVAGCTATFPGGVRAMRTPSGSPRRCCSRRRSRASTAAGNAGSSASRAWPRLPAASSADVLDEWQGLGYNRRALALWRAAGPNRLRARRTDAHRGARPEGASRHRARDGHRASGRLPTTCPASISRRTCAPCSFTSCFPASRTCQTPPCARSWPRHAPSTRSPWRVRMCRHALAAGTMPCSTTDITSSRRCPTRLVALARMSGSRASRGRTGKSGRRRAPAARRPRHGEGLSPAEAASALTALETAAGRDSVDEAYAREILAQLECEGFCHEQRGRWLA